MTVTIKNVDLSFFEVLKSLAQMRTNVEIYESDDTTSANKKKYSEKLEAFRSKYADLLNDQKEAKEIDEAFENLRDYSEPLKATREEIW